MLAWVLLVLAVVNELAVGLLVGPVVLLLKERPWQWERGGAGCAQPYRGEHA